MDYGVTAGDWPRKAECVREDPELFFPVGETGDTNRAQIRAAKAVCGRCVVRQECLKDALNHGEEFGIWGGLTEKERRKVKSRQSKVAQMVRASLLNL